MQILFLFSCNDMYMEITKGGKHADLSTNLSGQNLLQCYKIVTMKKEAKLASQLELHVNAFK